MQAALASAASLQPRWPLAPCPARRRHIAHGGGVGADAPAWRGTALSRLCRGGSGGGASAQRRPRQHARARPHVLRPLPPLSPRLLAPGRRVPAATTVSAPRHFKAHHPPTRRVHAITIEVEVRQGAPWSRPTRHAAAAVANGVVRRGRQQPPADPHPPVHPAERARCLAGQLPLQQPCHAAQRAQHASGRPPRARMAPGRRRLALGPLRLLWRRGLLLLLLLLLLVRVAHRQHKAGAAGVVHGARRALPQDPPPAAAGHRDAAARPAAGQPPQQVWEAAEQLGGGSRASAAGGRGQLGCRRRRRRRGGVHEAGQRGREAQLRGDVAGGHARRPGVLRAAGSALRRAAVLSTLRPRAQQVSGWKECCWRRLDARRHVIIVKEWRGRNKVHRQLRRKAHH